MADVKISQLPAATTPVDGTEVLPIVQSATTKQVSIANLTAGRAMAASSLTLTTPLAVTSGGTGLATTAAGTLLSSTALNTISATATPTLGVAGTTAGSLGLSGSSSGVVTIATQNAAGTWTLKLPTTAGSNGWILTTDGSGNSNWTNPTALGVDLDVGTTAITGGTSGRVLYNNAGVLGEYTITGTGSVVLGTSPTFTTNLTSPLVIGGTTASSSLTLQSTSGAGTSDSILLKVGNNGAVTAINIDSIGDVGIGTTSSAWDFGFQVLENSGGSISSGSNGAIRIMQNAYYGTSNYRYKFSSTNAARYEMAGGSHVWYSATSNLSAGGPVNGTGTWAQTMTLDASGNLGLKIAPSYRFDMAGDATAGMATLLQIRTGSGNSFGFQIRANHTNDECIVQNYYNAALAFGTNNTERARIDSSGNLLVGKTSLAITTVGFEASGSTGQCDSTMASSTSSQSTWNVYSTGAAAYRFYVNMAGTIYATSTTIVGISDRRLKENIVDLDAGLNELLALKPRKFDWKSGKGKNIKGDRGWIADEFAQVFPDLIDEWKDTPPEGEEPYKAVRPDLMPVVVKAIQELAAKVSALEAKQ
jgi:hypothetical protein